MKETFYFSHDYNARHDDKIKKLLRKHWPLGYGLYWYIIEDLYTNANALHLDYDGLAFDYRVDENIIKDIIENYWLFVINWDNFSSKSVQDRLDKRDSKSSKARESAKKRWRKKDANALQTQSKCNAIKESKVKESKVNNNNTSIIIEDKSSTQSLEYYIKENINIDFFIKEYNTDIDYIKTQLKEFYLYWSEKKPNWKKEKWQMQKTFDVSRRFHKRLSNNFWNKPKVSKSYTSVF